MKVLILSQKEPVDLYVIGQLARDGLVQQLIGLERDNHHTGVTGTAGRRTGVSSWGRRLFLGLHRRWINRRIAGLLLRDAPELALACETWPGSKVNSEDMARRLREISPDLMLVSGAPILKPHIFEIPPMGTVNLHWGIAPCYRGEHTLFWPLYFGDFARVGITLHFIDRGIDSGALILHAHPEMDRRDNELTVWIKCAKLAARCIADFLIAAESGAVSGEAQREKGCLYLYRDRTLRHQLRFLFRKRPDPSPQRIVTYYRADADKMKNVP